MENLIKAKIREIVDWPKKGVNFKDITPLLEDKEMFSKTIDHIAGPYLGKKIDKVVGIDARGFIFASALAYKLNCGLVIVRKKGKLPAKTISKEYSLEYGANTIEMHADSILPGENVLIVDDVLATGGTIKAVVDLASQLGANIIGIEFLIELLYLNGREKIKGQKINSLAKYESEKKENLVDNPQEKKLKIAIIGGTGFYDFFSHDAKELEHQTQFGAPSDKITEGKIFGRQVYFLPRHGKNHTLPPHKIPYKANITALKNLGVNVIIAPTAAGSLKPEIKPGDFVICDQYINKTLKREDTFYDGPKVGHIEAAYSYCPALKKIAIEQGIKLGLPLHPRGTAVVIEGPRFSTLAESVYFSKIGADVINMTQYPEVSLALEAGICYLNISLITDYDAGIYAAEKTNPVSIEQVMANFKSNTEKLKAFILAIIEDLSESFDCQCKKKSEQAKIN